MTPREAERTFERLESAEPLGSRVHGVLCGIAAAALLGPTSIAQFAFAPVLVMFFLRAHRAWPTWVHWFGQTPWLVVMVWAGWQAVTLAWSPDRAHGLVELADLRWAVLGVLVWPTIARRRWIIAGLIAGYALGHASQVFQGVQEALGVEQPFWDRDRRRLSGWWDPAVSGSLLTAAVGLHAGVVAMGRGRGRVVAAVALVGALIAVFATGTRSGWLASGATLGIVGAVAFVRTVRASSARRGLVLIGVLVGAVGIAGAGAWALAGDEIRLRAEETVREFERALEGDLDSATGARILMNKWAAEAFLDHPVQGVGIGGYRVWADAHARAQGEPDPGAHAHAHNALLHLLATQGVVGGVCALMIVACALRGAFAQPQRSAAEGKLGERAPRTKWLDPGSYDASLGFALVGLLMVSVFDTIQHNTQTAALFWLIVGVCVPWRPAFERTQSGEPERSPAA